MKDTCYGLEIGGDKEVWIHNLTILHGALQYKILDMDVKILGDSADKYIIMFDVLFFQSSRIQLYTWINYTNSKICTLFKKVNKPFV